MPILMIDVALPLSLQKFILGICTLRKLTFRTTTSSRKTTLLVLTPSENLIYGGGGGGYKMEWPYIKSLYDAY